MTLREQVLVEIEKLSEAQLSALLVYARQLNPARLNNLVPLESLMGICADDPIVLDDEGVCESLD